MKFMDADLPHAPSKIYTRKMLGRWKLDVSQSATFVLNSILRGSLLRGSPSSASLVSRQLVCCNHVTAGVGSVVVGTPERACGAEN